MPTRLIRTCCLVVSVVASGLTVGCSNNRYRVTFIMAPDTVATVAATGDSPFVTVTNRGPGTVQVSFPSAEAISLGSAATGRTVSPGADIRIETGEKAADVLVEARRASGLALNGPLPRAN